MYILIEYKSVSDCVCDCMCVWLCVCVCDGVWLCVCVYLRLKFCRYYGSYLASWVGWLASKPTFSLIYRVFIEYCDFSKILWNIFSTLGLWVCVCTLLLRHFPRCKCFRAAPLDGRSVNRQSSEETFHGRNTIFTEQPVYGCYIPTK